MKVLHVSTYDHYSGAAIAANRLHLALESIDVSTQMLVQEKRTKLPSVIGPKGNFESFINLFVRPKIGSLIGKLQKSTNPIKHSYNFLPSGKHRLINRLDPDIVHLHWINNEMITIKEISKIDIPIVWSFHDMWPFCGAEHVDDLTYPERYTKSYNKQNRPKPYTGIDLDKWTWKRKKKYWDKNDFNIVVPSKWMKNCVKKSMLFNQSDVTVIPNPINTDIFKPIGKTTARYLLNLPNDKKIICFGAIGASKNSIKGFNYLKSALRILKDERFDKKIILLIFGDTHEREEELMGYNVKYYGRVKEEVKLALIYSSVDLVVVPSEIESFGQVAAESLSTGTPVVSFDIAGLKDVINHRSNGYLAQPFDSIDLAEGIKWILNLNSEDYTRICKMGREKVMSSFDKTLTAEKYKSLYKSILETS
jgi:glycosyltransferase involved in cell wall biosynthesis